MAHVQLDDNPQAPIQQSVGEEFRQHDGVVTILMFYRRRASPKHRYNMTEVEYGGRGHRTRLRNDLNDQLCVYGVPPASVYKGWRRRRPAKAIVAARMGVLLPPGVGFPPPILVGTGFLEERKRGRGRRAAHLGLPLSPFH